MEAKELRLNNWVNHCNKEVQITIHDLFDIAVFEDDVFTPIPLTEEWLLKFGFERHDNGSVSAQFSYGINPVTQDYIIFLIWIKDYENDYQLNGFPFYQNGYFEIKTVHQLQNLFFCLCGKELSLNSE